MITAQPTRSSHAFAEVVVRAVHHGERRIGHDRIAGAMPMARDLRFVRRADVEEQAVAREDARALVGRHDVDVADARHGVHRPFDPMMIQR